MQQCETVRFSVAARPEAVRETRDAVRKTLADWGFEALADELVLCLSEALTNAITHAAHGDTVIVHAWCSGSVVRVEVMDGDQRPLRAEVPAEVTLPEPPSPDHQLEEHGRGLYLIDALSSRWGVDVQPLGKCVWFEKAAVPEP